mmetsp:Transcript_22488/g.53050  ORF Transcript_22488/g.53050 Transcript_22488/m.53050 type:complete len:341 (+) Transcript_22488:105-1127(+)
MTREMSQQEGAPRSTFSLGHDRLVLLAVLLLEQGCSARSDDLFVKLVDHTGEPDEGTREQADEERGPARALGVHDAVRTSVLDPVDERAPALVGLAGHSLNERLALPGALVSLLTRVGDADLLLLLLVILIVAGVVWVLLLYAAHAPAVDEGAGRVGEVIAGEGLVGRLAAVVIGEVRAVLVGEESEVDGVAVGRAVRADEVLDLLFLFVLLELAAASLGVVLFLFLLGDLPLLALGVLLRLETLFPVLLLIVIVRVPIVLNTATHGVGVGEAVPLACLTVKVVVLVVVFVTVAVLVHVHLAGVFLAPTLSLDEALGERGEVDDVVAVPLGAAAPEPRAA